MAELDAGIWVRQAIIALGKDPEEMQQKLSQCADHVRARIEEEIEDLNRFELLVTKYSEAAALGDVEAYLKERRGTRQLRELRTAGD